MYKPTLSKPVNLLVTFEIISSLLWQKIFSVWTQKMVKKVKKNDLQISILKYPTVQIIFSRLLVTNEQSQAKVEENPIENILYLLNS